MGFGRQANTPSLVLAAYTVLDAVRLPFSCASIFQAYQLSPHINGVGDPSSNERGSFSHRTDLV